jgi:hypothetical protein
MSGRRCKVLRAEFAYVHGRPPYRTRRDEHGYWTSEWRGLKKAYKAARSRTVTK